MKRPIGETFQFTKNFIKGRRSTEFQNLIGWTVRRVKNSPKSVLEDQQERLHKNGEFLQNQYEKAKDLEISFSYCHVFSFEYGYELQDNVGNSRFSCHCFCCIMFLQDNFCILIWRDFLRESEFLITNSTLCILMKFIKKFPKIYIYCQN